MLFFVIVSARVAIGLSALEHEVNDASQFMGRSRNGFWSTMSGSHTAIEGTKCTITSCQALGCDPEGSGSPILGWLCPSAPDPSAGDLVVGSKP